MTADFDYKKYSLEHLENWLHDALNCEDLTPQDIYETITNVVDENIEYHKKYLTKNIEFLSLLKGHRPAVDFDYTATGEKFSQYTEEELDAMCDAAAEQEEKDKCREYNLREAEYYNKRAQIDAQAKLDAEFIRSEYEAIKAAGGYEWTPEPPKEKKKTYTEMVAEGWTMTADGFWIKE